MELSLTLIMDIAIADRTKQTTNFEAQVTHIFVAHSTRGEWLIYRQGQMNPIQNLRKKSEAIENAKTIAKQCAPSEVLVEQPDGQFKPHCAFGETAILREPQATASR